MTPVFNTDKIKVLIGLGNPGQDFKNTYHNAGYLFVDYFSKNVQSPVKTFKSEVFMNQSGLFAKKILKKYGLKPAEILVAHDDSDIEISRYKISFGRGSAGHKGVESVIKNLKTKNFWRLRIGIRPAEKRRTKAGLPLPAGRQAPITERAKAGEFVLKNLSAADKKNLEKVFGEIAKIIFSLGN